MRSESALVAHRVAMHVHGCVCKHMCKGTKVASMHVCVVCMCVCIFVVYVNCTHAYPSCNTPYLKCHKLSSPQMSVSWVHSSCIQYEVLCVPLHSVHLDSCVGAPQNTPLLET